MQINKHIKSIKTKFELGTLDTEMLQHIWNKKNQSKLFAIAVKDSTSKTKHEIKFMIAYKGQVVNVSALIATIIEGEYNRSKDAVIIFGSGFNVVVATIDKLYTAIKPDLHKEDISNLRAVSFYTVL